MSKLGTITRRAFLIGTAAVGGTLQPGWMFGLIFAADMIAATFLFGALWVGGRSKAKTA